MNNIPDDLLHDEFELVSENPKRAADSAAVHGLLSLLGPDENTCTKLRVRRAMDAIRNDGTALRRWRIGSWSKSARAAVVLAAASLALVFLVLQVEESNAEDVLAKLVDATQRMTNRSYTVSTRQFSQQYGFETRATLDLGSDGRFLFSFLDSPQRPDSSGRAMRNPMMDDFRPMFGFDGDSFWMAAPRNRYVQGKDPGVMRQLLFTEESTDSTVMTLEPILELLQDGYEVRMNRPKRDATGRLIVVVDAHRHPREASPRPINSGKVPHGKAKGDPRGGRFHRDMWHDAPPRDVRIIVDGSNYEIISLDARWTGNDKQVNRQVVIEEGTPHAYDSSWFDASGHGLEETQFLEREDGMGGPMRGVGDPSRGKRPRPRPDQG
ncbi:MAG: hypothetical protein O2800_04730 [Planctomycetota bacterium]|nr:hypothetical protein [Planctomycetota bacterium]